MPSFHKRTLTSPLSVSPEHHINLVPNRTTSIPELEQESEQELEQEWEKELEQESEAQSEEKTKTAESSTSTATKKNGGEYTAAAQLKGSEVAAETSALQRACEYEGRERK
ncbi:hypothetical protein RUND412_005351 [Rhizina undulata]